MAAVRTAANWGKRGRLMSERYDTRDADWPLRPWIMAAIGAVAGLVIELFGRHGSNDRRPGRAPGRRLPSSPSPPSSFVLTVEQRRWPWALAFALGWGAVVALVGWFTAQLQSAPRDLRIPLPVGAVRGAARRAPVPDDARRGRVALPLCPAPRPRLDRRGDRRGKPGVRRRHLPPRLADRRLFDVIGIDAIKDLLQESWFGWMLAGFAFGAAVGMLRERDALMATLQRLVMVVLAVLAPVLAAALLLFLLSLPFTGLGELWDSSIPATPMMLLAGAGAILLVNAVIGNGGDDRATSRVLRLSALVLVLTVLPLAIIAALSLGQRIGQYGWTPERIWGVVAVVVALAYGLVGWWTVVKGRDGVRRTPPPAPDKARARPVRPRPVPRPADPRLRRDLGQLANGALRRRASVTRGRVRLAGHGVRLRPRRPRAARRDRAQRHPGAAQARGGRARIKDRYDVEERSREAREARRCSTRWLRDRARRGQRFPPGLPVARSPRRASAAVGVVRPDGVDPRHARSSPADWRKDDALADVSGMVSPNDVNGRWSAMQAQRRATVAGQPPTAKAATSRPRRVEVRTVERRQMLRRRQAGRRRVRIAPLEGAGAPC